MGQGAQAVTKDLITICAAGIALVSIFIAICQLRTTAANIKSNTIYQISHEGREIAKTITPNMQENQIGPVVNFMQSVWDQHQLGTYDEQLWEPFTEEVCQFLKNESNFDSYWHRSRKQFAVGFGHFIEERRKQCGA
jgi:hypothetical protein